MNVKEIPLPKQNYKHNGKERCSKEVDSHGTSYFNGNGHICGRVARFNIDGELFCKQHAGDKCLEYVFNLSVNKTGILRSYNTDIT